MLGWEVEFLFSYTRIFSAATLLQLKSGAKVGQKKQNILPVTGRMFVHKNVIVRALVFVFGFSEQSDYLHAFSEDTDAEDLGGDESDDLCYSDDYVD